MARKLPKSKQQPAAETRPAAAGDLDVLHPERVLSVHGRTVEVREYGYIEGLKIQAASQPFLDALYAMVASAAAPPPAHVVRKLFAAHAVSVQWMIAQAITPPNDDDVQAFMAALRGNADWVASLDDIEGDALTAVWWEVNRGFFIRRLREQTLAAREAAAPSPSASAGSTQP